MRKTISFDDVLLVPKFSSVMSRHDIDLSVDIPKLQRSIDVPIVSAPMDSVTEDTMAAAMYELGGLGIIHRYNSPTQQAALVAAALEIAGPDAIVGAAVGVSGDFEDRATAVYDAGARVLCLDIAHGHHALMKKALKRLKSVFGHSVHLMAGNVATLEAFNDLSDWGADSIRVGIGGGSICSTRVQTGHGVPTLQSVVDCSRSDRPALLIADGGIKNSGDMVKSLAAGADLVMCGSLLSGTDETPGDTIRPAGGTPRKVYRGMASREAQKSWRNKVGSIEGISTTVEIKGPVEYVLKDLAWGIRSGLSYSGCSSLSELRSRCELILQTSSGTRESNTHILNVI